MENHKVSLLSTFNTFLDQFLSESDRAAVILGAAKVEFLLAELLEKYLLPSTSASDDLLEGDSPLATFSAKIKICHRLGIIDERCTKLLHTFRRLRNVFAHEVSGGSLNDGSARDRVHSLAEPFLEVPYFVRTAQAIATRMNRPPEDAGVLFRAFLAMLHVYLANVHQKLPTGARHKIPGVIEFLMLAPKTDDPSPAELAKRGPNAE